MSESIPPPPPCDGEIESSISSKNSDETEETNLNTLQTDGEDKSMSDDSGPTTIRVSPPRKSSASGIPKPTISPKPDHLKKPEKTSEKLSAASSMLRNTLKRMTRLSLRSDPQASKKSNENLDLPSVKPGRTLSPGDPMVNRSRSFKEPPDPKIMTRSFAAPQNPAVQSRNSALTGSLRRSRVSAKDGGSENGGHFQRAGTNGTMERRRSVNNSNSVYRSQSVTGGRRSLAHSSKSTEQNIRKSRACQTQLTRDVFADEDAAADENPPTQLDFTLFMPGLLGVEDDHVETHVTEVNNEPIDVRRNRQLTLDNMRLNRELEQMKSQVHESEGLKRELRSQHLEVDSLRKELKCTKLKLEEEKIARTKIEDQLDKHNEKVKMIVQSMDCVEKEFETRDENISSLEKRIQDYKEIVTKQQNDLDSSNELISNLQQELEKSLAGQRVLFNQYREAEAESRELQEFLQAEKMTLAETLKDCENEIALLKSEVEEKDKEVQNVEERCSHLVRLGEQRHQESLTLQAQLNTMQEKANQVMLEQGSELSRANIHISELREQFEKLLTDTGYISDVVENGLKNKSSNDFLPAQTKSLTGSLNENNIKGFHDTMSSSSLSSDQFYNTDFMQCRSESQFLIQLDKNQQQQPQNSSLSYANGSSKQVSSLDSNSDSLQNLSKAITNRQNSENMNESVSSTNSLPSLVDRIHEVQVLLEKYVKVQQQTNSNVTKISQQQMPYDKDSVASSKHNSDINGDLMMNGSTKDSKEQFRTKLKEKENLSTNGNKYEEQLQIKENEINEMKSKFLRHRQILVTNYEEAENEIRRLDEIYHDTIGQVLKALSSIPDVIQKTPNLQQLQKSLEVSFVDSGSSKALKSEISSALNQRDTLNANQSL